MKYIRTKDGIFEVVKEDGNWLEIISNFEVEMQCHCVIKKHAVIKQADTIQELCDAFVVWEDKRLLTIIDYENAHIKHIKEMAGRLTVYGTIYTDKGLIYVAKMNEEGKLCLL